MIIYHGCSKTDLGEAIIKDGFLRPRSTQGRDHLAPIVNRVYGTTELKTASIYALGGVFAGHPFPEEYRAPGMTGYIFKAHVDPSSCIPDEDCVGSILCQVQSIREGREISIYEDHPTLAAALRADPDMANHLHHTISQAMTDQQRRKATEGYIAYMASGGKRALPMLSSFQKKWLIEHGANLAHAGELRWVEAWSVDKRLSSEIKSDGSNLFAIAALEHRQDRTAIPSLQGATLQVTRRHEGVGLTK